MLRLLCLLALAAFRLKAQSPSDLRCEWQHQPKAIQTETPRFSWIVAANANQHGIRQTAYRLIVASSMDALNKRLPDKWDSLKTDSAKTLDISYGGTLLTSSTPYFWAVEIWDQDGKPHWSSVTSFQTALLHQSDWQATWIAAAQSPEREISLPLFRRSVFLEKKISRATIYISGLGQYELHLNGRKLGKAVMAPGWTDYRKTVLYNCFDVTADLQRGENVFAVSLGNGMYNVESVKSRYTKFSGSFGPPKLLFQAHIIFADRTIQNLISDQNWHTLQGPTTFSSIYGGEDYDARLEQAGWDRPGFKEKEWLQAQETEGPGGSFVAQQSPPIEVQKTIDSIRVTEPGPGVFVYDLGQNFAGWPQIGVKGPRGSSVRLIPGELLDRSGFVSQRTSGSPIWFNYTLMGQKPETWHPKFTYSGFRYIQVERTPDAGINPELSFVKGQFIYSDADKTGSFETSDKLLNGTHDLIDQAIKSNLQSIITDCPHREKLGWLEQSHLLGFALLYNFDLVTLYEKIVDDMADAQQSNGLIPDIAPEFTIFNDDFRDSPEWGSAYVLDPWLCYRVYGDTTIIASHYQGMKRYVNYLSSKAVGGIISYGLSDWYDIGPGEPGRSKLTSPGVTATAIYYQDLQTLADCAKLLGKPQDEIAFRQQADTVKQAFNKQFYSPDIHTYDRKSQTAYAMALVTGLAPKNDCHFILELLISEIRAHNNHVTSGDVGFHYVVEALMDNGRSDVLYDLLSRTDAPSYGDQLAKGATSLTEAWDANPLSSQNHLMLGAAEEWFYRALAGIDLDFSRPEAERLIIRPTFISNLTHVDVTYHSVIGEIKVAWAHNNAVTSLTLDIPANTTAKLLFPAPKLFSDHLSGATLIDSTERLSTYQLLSGHYVFRNALNTYNPVALVHPVSR